jgi:uncharacterized protein (DUF2235 family)
MRRLVVFCDGTWKSADDGVVTNVVKLMDLTLPVAPDGTPQILYYGKGVGTGNVVDRLTGGAFGDGLETNVKDAYRFLVQNYAEEDEIYLFGFSRGAFTARSLSGLIRCCWLVRKENAAHINEAYKIYRQKHPDGADKPDAVAFRGKYSRQVRIKCIGVWDTVGALGVPGTLFRRATTREHGFHDTALSSYVDNGFHALAIGEGRYTFEPSLWKSAPKDGQRVEQRWFAGAHSNVGGGYNEHGLSDYALRWMADRAVGCGLALHPSHAAIQGKVEKPEDARYLKFLPGNVRDVLSHPLTWSETLDASAADVYKQFGEPENHSVALLRDKNRAIAAAGPRLEIKKPEESAPPPLVRPAMVRLLRNLFGSNRAAQAP